MKYIFYSWRALCVATVIFIVIFYIRKHANLAILLPIPSNVNFSIQVNGGRINQAQTLRPAPRVNNTVLLCAHVRGRVGNAFFAYLSMHGIALANNLTLVFKDESVLREVIKNPPKTDPDFNQKCAGATRLKQPKGAAFNKELMRLQRNVSAYIVSSGLCSWEYFEKIKDKVPTLLEFRPDIVANATAVLKPLRARTKAVLVGMHVRRGDMASKGQVESGRNLVTTDYLFRAMHYFTDRFSPVHFVVASDDRPWCKKFVASGRQDVTILENSNTAAEDIAILTLTDHMIISVGTFGWWAGYLNPGIKTYMEDFVRPGSVFIRSFSSLHPKDYIYPGWVPL